VKSSGTTRERGETVDLRCSKAKRMRFVLLGINAFLAYIRGEESRRGTRASSDGGGTRQIFRAFRGGGRGYDTYSCSRRELESTCHIVGHMKTRKGDSTHKKKKRSTDREREKSFGRRAGNGRRIRRGGRRRSPSRARKGVGRIPAQTLTSRIPDA